jgi:ATP-dependent DNA ligase
LHEIKYDGYRLIVQRDGDRVRLFSRNGNDWTGRYPWIVEAALKNRFEQFVIDGEAIILGVDGIADFNALHSRQHEDEVQLYAFDILALDGEDLRKLPLRMRKTNLARLLARRPDGIFVDRSGPVQGCLQQGLEGLVSKRADRPYRAGRSKDWIKCDEPKPPGNEPGDGVVLTPQNRRRCSTLELAGTRIARFHNPASFRRQWSI